MNLHLFSGSAHPALAAAVAAELRISLGQCELERFPDGEFHVAILETVRGADVYLLQPTGPSAETHLLELFLLADAAQRAGAARVTAVVPYFGYARQDRRSGSREPVAARVIADLFVAGRVQHVVTLDLHTASLEGFFAIPIEHVTALPLLAEATRPHLPSEGVIVAPDLGAARLAEYYAARLGLPVAIVHKTRLSGEQVRASRITGDVRGRVPVIVDDMISTAGTTVAAVEAAVDAGAITQPLIIATHALLVGSAVQRLSALAPRRVVVTDSLPSSPGAEILPLHRVSTAPLLAETIRCLHEGESLSHLLARG